MDTTQYLDQIYRIDLLTRNKLADLGENIQRINDALLSAVAYDSDRVQTSAKSNPTEKTAITLASMEQETDREVRHLLSVRRTIIRQIELMDDPMYYDVLFRKHVLRESINEIAESHGASWSQIKKLYFEAVSVFEDKYGQEYLSKTLETL